MDLVGNPNSGVDNTVSAAGFGPAFFNAGAFAVPRGLTFGNSGRNILRNPRRTNFDMALFKHFAIKENMGFEFRAEAYNVFNHTEWAWLGGDGGSAANNSPFGSPTNTCADLAPGTNNCTSDNGFLRVAAAHNARILQLGLKFIF